MKEYYCLIQKQIITPNEGAVTTVITTKIYCVIRL